MVFHYSLLCIAPVANGIKHLFVCLSASCVSSLLKHWFRIFCPFHKLSHFFLVLELYKSLYAFIYSYTISTLSDGCVIFLPPCNFLFLFSILPFEEQKFYILMKSKSSEVFFQSLYLLCSGGKFYLPRDCGDFHLKLSFRRFMVLGLGLVFLCHMR